MIVRLLAVAQEGLIATPRVARLLAEAVAIQGPSAPLRSKFLPCVTLNHADVVEELLRRGAKVNREDSFGHTAMSYAAKARSAKAVAVLAKYGGRERE